MYASITQIVALVIYGNHFLQTGCPHDFFSDPSDTSPVAGCQSVTFLDWRSAESVPPTQLSAQTPQQWYQRLRDDGVQGLRVHATGQAPDDERAPAVFRGGFGFWLIEAVSDSCSDHWRSRWHQSEKPEAGNRIWLVIYEQIARQIASWQDHPAPLEQTIEELDQLLPRLISLSEKYQFTGFAACFRRASQALRHPNPLANSSGESLSPSGYLSREAQALLAAAQAAWVFGGMGSWNDQRVDEEDEATYTSLSDQLATLLDTAIVQATNTSFSIGSDESHCASVNG